MAILIHLTARATVFRARAADPEVLLGPRQVGVARASAGHGNPVVQDLVHCRLDTPWPIRRRMPPKETNARSGACRVHPSAASPGRR